MERYWCLRWIVQENRKRLSGRLIRENLVRLDALPLVLRVPSLPPLEAGAAVEIEVLDIDFLDLALRAEFSGRVATRRDDPGADEGRADSAISL